MRKFTTLSLFWVWALVAEAVEVEVKTATLPVLNDGELSTVMDFGLACEAPRILTGIVVDTDGTTALSEVEEIQVVMRRSAGDLMLGSSRALDKIVIMQGEAELPKGNHTCSLVVRMKKGADLDHRVGLQLKELVFKDGARVRVDGVEGWEPSRLAYPIHKRGQFECHTFRIPAIARANDGALLAVYDMRYNSRRDLQEHMDIGLSRSVDGGQSWSRPEPIMDMGEYGGKPEKENGCSDPGILVDQRTGEVIVTACWTHGKPRTHQWVGNGSEPGHSIDKSTQFMAVRSSDHGKSWSAPENWTQALKDPSWYLFAPAPGNGITLADGTLVMPTQGRDANGLPFSNITWSKDRGKTWTVSSFARSNTTECAVAELSDGTLMLNMRDNRNRKDKGETNGRAVAVTQDLGKQWEVHGSDHGALPEPVCMASLISFKGEEGKHGLLFSNPHDKHGRRKMTIQMSMDDGKSWPKPQHILLDSKGGAYSSLVMIDEKTVGILYESSAADMVFQRVPLSDFGK
ncbi:exo-alpha-sialidase [Rubritalea tangerina]|uniref:exo-alpha-sialidase n=2 Tax=Rubritalea tangerina TaxID=430798 RepID=A0ABW4ZEZ7_9BACT